MRQMLLHPNLKVQKEFGGELLNGKRKAARPISTRDAMHVTLRSDLARRDLSFLMPKNNRLIREVIKTLAARFGIQIYQLSVNSNHLHLLTRTRTRGGFKNFLRLLSGTIAMKLTRAKKGSGLLRKFWAGRPWSRIVAWSAFAIVRKYVIQNSLEAAGTIPYRTRGRYQSPKPTPTVLPVELF